MINTGKNKRMEKSQNQIKRDKYNIYLPDVPDVGRYTPSYKVLDKHSYQVAFCQQNFYDFNKLIFSLYLFNIVISICFICFFSSIFVSEK